MNRELRDTVALVAGSGVTSVLALAYVVLAGRKLGPAGYAGFAAGIALLNLVQMSLGPINSVITRFAARYAERSEPQRIVALKRWFHRAILLYALPLLLAAALASPLAAAALRFASPLPLLVVLAVAFFGVLLNVDRGILRGLQRFDQHNLNTISEAATRLAVGLLLLALAPSTVNALLAYLIAAVLAVALLYRQLRSPLERHSAASIDGAEVVRFALPMLAFSLGMAGFQNADMLVAKRVLDAEAAGLYGAATALAVTLSVLFWPFSIQALPLFTARVERAEPLGAPILRLGGVFLLLAAVPLALFAWMPGPLLRLVYGADFVGAAAALLPLGAGMAVGFLSILLALAHAAAGRFGFLWVYLGGLAVELAALVLRHDSIAELAGTVLAAKIATLAAMLLYHALAPAPHRPRKDDAP